MEMFTTERKQTWFGYEDFVHEGRALGGIFLIHSHHHGV